MTDDQSPPERPRTEPEIIPPDRAGGRGSNPRYGNQPWRTTWQTSWGQDGAQGTQRIFVMRPGPLASAIFLLVLALIVAAVVLTVIGAFLIWIPVVAVFVAVAAVYRFLFLRR